MKIQPLQDIAALELLWKSLYVDDCVASHPSVHDADHCKQVSTSCMASAGMELRRWRGNTISEDAGASQKVNGVTWNTTSDTIHVTYGKIDKDGSQPWTRLLLLWAVASLFDTLGLVSATYLTGKILHQRAWQKTSSWDQPLGPQLAACVEIWWESYMSRTCHFQGGYTQTTTPIAAHVFADASEKAYGCCIYVVVGQTSHLVFSKTKMVPLKALTLP